MVDSVLEVKQIKQLSADGGATVLDVQNQTIAVGSITDAAGAGAPNFPNGLTTVDYGYLQGTLQANITLSGSAQNINFDGSTAPYFTLAKDDNTFTNTGELARYIKVLKSGIYQIGFSLTARQSADERYLGAFLYKNDIEVSSGYDQIIYTESSSSYGNVYISYVGPFSVNNLISVEVASASGGNAQIYAKTHISMVLVREST